MCFLYVITLSSIRKGPVAKGPLIKTGKYNLFYQGYFYGRSSTYSGKCRSVGSWLGMDNFITLTILRWILITIPLNYVQSLFIIIIFIKFLPFVRALTISYGWLVFDRLLLCLGGQDKQIFVPIFFHFFLIIISRVGCTITYFISFSHLWLKIIWWS